MPLEELELLACKLQGVLVVDEAYIDYATAADGTTPAGLAASFIPRLATYPNVIVLRTFSKSYSMAGAVCFAADARRTACATPLPDTTLGSAPSY